MKLIMCVLLKSIMKQFIKLLLYEKYVSNKLKLHYLYEDPGAKGEPGEPPAAVVMSAMAIQAAIQEVDLGKSWAPSK